MDNIKLAEKKIKMKISDDCEWIYPYWLDEIKEEFSDITEQILENVYFKEIQAKIDSMSHEELRKVLEEQNTLTSANQNFYVMNLIEERLRDTN